MRVYIAGCGGMLGEAFYQVFTSKKYVVRASDKDVNADWLQFLDFRDSESYISEISNFKPDLLIHLGAYTDLEFCENNIEDSYLTNTISVETAVQLSNQLNIPLLYISTAGIFDGAKDLYDDWDTPNPLGVYARSKYMGERYVLENCLKPFVCRAGWMMGGGPNKDKKFIQKLMSQLKSGSTTLHVVTDKDGTPTYTLDFAANCEALLKTDYYGLYNMVCGGQTSRFEVAQELLSILGLQDSINLVPVSSDYFADTYFAARPPSERLVNYKLNLRNLNLMRDWKICLSEYIADRYSDYL